MMKTVIMAEFSDARFDARVLKQANTLVQAGYRVFLVMYNAALERQATHQTEQFIFVQIPFPNRYHTKNAFERTGRVLSSFIVLLQYARVLLSAKGDYYHAHNYFVGWLVYLSCILRGGTFVYDCHEIIWDIKDERLNILGGIIEGFMIRRARLCLCPSLPRSTLIADHYRLKDAPIVIGNYPHMRSESPRTKNRLREQLGIEGSTKILFYSGMLSVHTRMQDNVIKAMANISTPLCFVLVGFGHPAEISYLLEVAGHTGSHHRVKIIDPQPHDVLRDLTECADIGISLLRTDRLDMKFHALNKFYEYVSAGLAVLASDSDSFRQDVLVNGIGQLGVICNPYNTDSIASALNVLLSNIDLLERCKRNALKAHREKWNWESQEHVLIEAYRRL